MSAVFSRCGRYRYRLERAVGPGITAAYIGVNPSRADATANDATIRKLIGFAPRHGIGHWLVGNVFAYAATDISDLRACDNPTGPGNDRHLKAICAEAELIVLGWGTLGKLPATLRNHHKRVLRIVARSGQSLHCWGKTQDGQPRHPLMLPYNSPLIEWTP